MQMNWNPFKSITALESRIRNLEDQVLDLHMRLSEDAKTKKALDVLRKARQRDYGRRYYEKKKAEKAAKEQA
jgi:hypothetical protein